VELGVDSYVRQVEAWPPGGQHLLAQYSESSVAVFIPSTDQTADFLAEYGVLGAALQSTGMLWLRTNFLSAMKECQWGRRSDFPRMLVVYLRRESFEVLLSKAVLSTFQPHLFETKRSWELALRYTLVRARWVEDPDPSCSGTGRQGLELGIRGDVLRSFSGEWVDGVEDITEFVHSQRSNSAPAQYPLLKVPVLADYPMDDDLALRLGFER
jgi:hypothetical protein